MIKFIKKNWKTVVIAAIVIIGIANYKDIKSGFIDGWNSTR